MEKGHSRFAALDGLRAVAALSVALWHFQSSVPRLDALLPQWTSRAIAHANVGVEIFFVLSGFAVARSLVGAELGARALGRFMLRRTVRLDPPYLLTLAIVVTLALVNPAAWPVHLSLGRVIAHVLYLQGLLGMPNLLGIYWTLALEIQLYFVCALLMTFGQRVRILARGRTETVPANHGFSALLCLSVILANAFSLMPHEPRWNDTFVPWWPVFCLGVLTERALRLPPARGWLLAAVTYLFVSIHWRFQIGAAVAVGTVFALVSAAFLPPVRWILASRVLTELGLRSYSFYLLHSLVGGMAMHVVSAHLPLSAAGDGLRLFVAFAVSGAASWLLWRLVEVPAQRLGRRIRLDASSRSEATSS